MSSVALIFLFPYFLWGFYTLHRRFRFQEELSARVQILTLLFVCVFFALEIHFLKPWMNHHQVLYFFTILGLFVSAFALYGHIAIALLSGFLVDMVVSGHDAAPDKPRFGAAEALERQGDYEGAYKEYLVLGRIFPHHPSVLQRIGEALVALERYPESAPWFERAFGQATQADLAEGPALRYDDILSEYLNDSQGGKELLRQFIERFPETEESARISMRLSPPREKQTPLQDQGLVALELEPLAQIEDATPDKHEPASSTTVAEEEGMPMLPEREEKKESPSYGIEALDANPLTAPLALEAPGEEENSLAQEKQVLPENPAKRTAMNEEETTRHEPDSTTGLEAL